MKFAESLPDNCPPESAKSPNNEVFYRLTSSPPSEDDFISHYRKFPQKKYSNNLCIAKSISIWSDIEHAKRMMKTPRFRGTSVTEITLPPDSGLLLEGKSEHFSFWLSDYFEPLLHCRLKEDAIN